MHTRQRIALVLGCASSLSSAERNELAQLCDDAINSYLEKRGAAVYDHRRTALGYLSGSLRYEVLKRAGFRCELCGISADERAIEGLVMMKIFE